MKKYSVLVLFLLMNIFLFGQNVSLDSLVNLENKPVFVKNLSNDSLISSFYIEIQHKVAKHKHLAHSESIYVIDGEANMFLGEKEFVVRKGDFVFIPKNTPHSVKVISNVPLKVLSVQAPFFDGKDRVLLEE